MDAKFLLAAGLIATALSGLPAMNPEPLPEGWLVNGGLGSWFYTATIDHHHSLSPSGAKLIQSSYIVFQEGTFCAISQRINPIKYRGKRVRFSAMVSVKDVQVESSLYIRADTPVSMGESSARTEHAAIRGTQDWRLHEVVIDVPKDAILLSFGLTQDGRGSSWMDNVRLDVVESNTALTKPVSSTYQALAGSLPVDPVF